MKQNIYKIGLYVLMFLPSYFLVGNLSAQVLISPTGDGGFENGATFAANGWTEVNGVAGTNNNFFIGNVAVPSAGSNSAYISDNITGTTYNYNTSSASTVHFYRDVTFPAGATSFTLTFKWKGQGESSYDYLTCYSMPTSQTPVFNSPAGGFQSWLNIPTAYPGAVIHSSPVNLNLQTAYQTQTICLPAAYAGTTRRLVFMWSNDPSLGANPPGTIDEISLVASTNPVAPTASPTALVLTPTANSVMGSFAAAAGAPDGYLVVRTATAVPPSSPVNNTFYTPGSSALGGVIVSSGPSTTFTSTGLLPNTQYFYWVYSYNGTACAGPVYKSTSPLSGNTTTLDCSIMGTKTVGLTGTYLSLTAAIADLNSNGIGGPVILELQSSYLSSAEPAFPIVIPEFLCASPTRTLTIRPQTGAVGLAITSVSTVGTISINAGDYVTIDGRAGGVGVSQLTISNTTTTGYAIQFINGATNNNIKYCSVLGVNTSTVNGVIWFSTTTTAGGNSNNSIDNCTIKDGLTTPTNGIYASGTTTTLATHNSNNTISNCNIINTFAAASTSYGINVGSGNTDWTISGNSIYQTVSRASSTIWGGMLLSNTTTGNNFLVTGNYIGGTAPLCGGSALTFTGSTLNFRGMNISLASSVVSVFNNNTIANLNLTTTGTSGFNGAIIGGQGLLNITNNTIGLASSTNNIQISASGSAFNFSGILCGGGTPADIMNITGNTIAGIQMTVTGSPATVPTLRVISVQSTLAGSSYNVNNNTVGSTSVANSISLNANSGLIGIISFSIGTGQSISQNTVANLYNSNVGANAAVTGIAAQGSGSSPNILGTFTVTGNTIRDLSCASASITFVSAVGFTIFGNGQTSGSNLVNQNNIYNISNTNNTAVGTAVFGAIFNLPTAIISTIERNKIHSINTANTSSSGVNGVTAIQINSGNGIYQNNFIRVGVDASGADENGNHVITGITEAAGTNTIVYNSVYIGGQAVATGTSNSFAFRSSNLVAGRVVRNNIFFNNRSNGAGTGKNYAINLPGTTASQTGLACDNNILFAPGTGGVLGLFNAADYNTLAAWRTATGMDWASLSANPQFIAPNGNSTTVDLHIQAAVATPVEANGAPLASTPQDIDAQTRASLTPSDIGADAGNFTPVADLTPPGISYVPFPTTQCGTTDLPLNAVLISDLSGVPTTGTLKPRVYYRKASGTWFSQAGTLASGSATNGTWNFTIVAADMGGLVSGDMVTYYVIAQDNVAIPNVGSYIGGVVATDVNTVTTHPINAFTTTVQTNLMGTIPVGVGGTFSTLTLGAAAYNAGCINGNVVFSLTDGSYPAETYPITFNAIPSANATNTLTIKPAPGATVNISGSSATCLIRFNGADYITIDGSNTVGGTTRDLTLTNTSIAANTAVVCVQSLGTGLGATNDAIKNTNIIGGSNTVATFGIHVAGTTVSTTATGDDNDNLTIQNNSINTVQYGIYARASSVAGSLDGLSILQNSIGSNALTTNYIGLRGIDLAYINGANISQNTLFNLKTTTQTSITAIECGAGVQNSSFNRNNINGVYNDNTGQWAAYGINFNTSTSVNNNLIANNFISDMRNVNYSSSTTYGAYGIRLTGGTNFTIANNSVHFFGVVTLASGSNCFSAPLLITTTGVTGTILKNNIFFNEQSFSTSATSLAYSLYVPSGFVFAQINNNDYYGVSNAPTTYKVGNNGVDQATLANWQTAYPADNMSLNINPLFTSDTDLHIVSNDCLNQGGMPVAGVTVDYDGMVRDLTKPDIGADEFNGADVTFAFTETSGIANNDGIICAGASVTLTATNGATYLWSPGGATTPSIIVNPNITTTYSVTVTLAGACTRTFTQIITVNPLPVTTITPSNPTINCNQSVTLSASGTGTFLWSPGGATTSSITVTPLMTTVYSVTLTNSNGCTASSSTTVTVTPPPSLSSVNVEPTTCVSSDGSINLTVSGGVPPFTYNWSSPDGVGLINGQEDQSGLSVGTYFVTVTGAGCSNTAQINLVGPGNCQLCPTIGTLTNVNNNCKQTGFSLVASGLASMGSTYGIIFKYSASALADPYVGGTVLGTITNGSLTSGGSIATLNGAIIPTAGTYFLYAILTPSPISPACRPSATKNISIENCTPVISDPCSCKNNATTLTNGQFNEGITVNAPAGQTWTVSAVTGLYLTSSPAPPAAPIIIPNGFVLTPSAPLANGSVNYVLMGVHIDAIGYNVSVTNSGGVTLSVGSTCYYPNPQINGLAATYCTNSPNVTLAGSATLGGPPGGAASGIGTFTVNGIPNTIFSPSTLGVGTHTVVYSFDAADGVPNPSHPGCTQSVTQSVLVNPVPTVTNPGNKTFCNGVATGGITFTGTATSYNWTNTNTLIGLAASGTASPTIPSWIPVNNTNLPIVGTITVTPVYTAGGGSCTGTPITFTITISPAPKAVCQNYTLYLNAAGQATLLPSNIDGGSAGGTLSISQSAFTCANIGANSITLTVTDACGGKSSCVAIVTVADNIPPVVGAIPADLSLECSATIPAPPVVTAIDNCSAIVTMTETSSKTNYPSQCSSISYDITRTWTATDPSGNKASKSQKISIKDTKAPSFTIVPPAFITVECDDDNANNINPIAVDGCDATPTMLLDIQYDFNKNGCPNSYLATYTWTAGDKCGNTAVYVQKITVQDTVPPVIACPANIEVVSSVAVPVTWVAPKSKDNCGGNTAIAQIAGPPSGSVFQPGTITTITYICKDQCGNTSKCSFTVSVKKAGTKVGSTISGNVSNEKSNPIAAEVQLSGSVNQFGETNGGAFSFAAIADGSDITVNAEQLKYPLNGVNSLDLVYITNHILGKKALTSPYKMLAADINHSNTVTTADLVEIRKLILHITDQFANAKSWEFITAPNKFSNPNNPWLDLIKQNVVLNNIHTDQTVNFIGYKMGDVTDDANPNSVIAGTEARSSETLELYAKDQTFVAGDEIEVGINGQDLAQLKALQFTLNFDKDALDFVSIKTNQANMSADNFGLRFLNDGKITASMDWSNRSNNNELFTLVFKSKTNGSLKNSLTIGSSLTTAKAFDLNEKAMDVDLSFNNQIGQVLKSNPILYQNEPNPFESNTVINFYLPEASHSIISIYNIAGNLIKEVEGNYPRGENKILLDKKDLPAAGIYLYKLNNGGFTDIKKMILVK